MLSRPSPPTPLCNLSAPISARIQPATAFKVLSVTCSNRKRHTHSEVSASDPHAPAQLTRGQPPVLRQQECAETWHGQTRRDEYSWLSDTGPTHPEVLKHLKAENQYTISCLAHTRELQLSIQRNIQAWKPAAAAATPEPDDVQQEQQYQRQQHPDQQQQATSAKVSAAESTGELQQQHQGVQRDWLAGAGHLQYQQHRQFGNPGFTVGYYRFFSVSADSSSGRLLHCRAAAAVIQSDSYSLQEPEAAPSGTVVLWNESGGSSSNTTLWRRCSSSIHSLAVSPCGCYLAVTFRTNTHSQYGLAVVSCSTGDLLLQPVEGVDGPVLWLDDDDDDDHDHDHDAVRTSGPVVTGCRHSSTAQQRQQQYLLYVADNHREVYCLTVPDSKKGFAAPTADSSSSSTVGSAQPTLAASAAAVAGLPVPAPSLIFRDPQHVSLDIAAAEGHTFITVFGADGLVRQVLHYSSSSSGSNLFQDGRLLPDQAEAWQVLLPATTLAKTLGQQPAAGAAGRSKVLGPGIPDKINNSAAAAAAGIAAAGDNDPTMRLAITCVGDLLFVRHSCAVLPQGQLLLGQLQQQHNPQQEQVGVEQQQEQPDIAWQLLLPAQDDLLLESVFVCPATKVSNSSGNSSSSSNSIVNVGFHLLILGWKRHQWQQQQQQQEAPEDSSLLQTQQQLQVQVYALSLNASQNHQQQQRRGQPLPTLELQHSCTLPFPDAFYEVHSASWHPQDCELHIEFSSTVRPRSRLTANLPRLALEQQQQQQQQQLVSDVAWQRAVTMSNTANEDMQAAAAAAATAAQVTQLAAAPADYSQINYATLQFGVASRDGSAMIPVSLAYNTQTTQLPATMSHHQHHQQQHEASAAAAAVNGIAQNRLLLSCYGSYGIRENVSFNPELLQLLAAGWCVCWAHVRGGGWCGRSWAEAGRGARKTNSVQDLLAVAEYVHMVGLVSPGGLCIQGSSAGCWLASSALLQQPALFAAAVLTVPCLDPLGLMLQQNQGGLELGPAADDAQVYNSIRSWAPYDLLEQFLYPNPHKQWQQSGPHISRQLPHVLIRAALNDEEVPISDPIKALARLRRWYKPDSHHQQQQQQQQQWHAALEAQHGGPTSPECDDDSGGLQPTKSFPQDRLLLLRVVPGGHLAFQGLVRESALKIAFLLSATERR